MNTTFQFFDFNGQAVLMSVWQVLDTESWLGYRYDDTAPVEALTVAQAQPPASPP